METINFIIPLAPITKKNSQQQIEIGERCPRCRRGKRTVPIPSARFKKYEQESGHFIKHRNDKIDCPVNIKAIYYMPTKRRVDLTNLHEALHDILVDYGVIADDNANIIVGTDGSRVKYDKNSPRTEVTIELMAGEPYQESMVMEEDW